MSIFSMLNIYFLSALETASPADVTPESIASSVACAMDFC